MGTPRSAWTVAAVVSAAAVACGSSVTVEPTSAGGGGAGASSPGGGSGGAAAGGMSAGGANGGEGGAGGEGGSPTGAGGEGGGVCRGFGDPCTECMAASCQNTFCACSEEIHCFGYLQCRGTCMMGDTACIQSCAAVHEPGISAAVLVADCAATACDASCDFGQALNDCQKCLYTDCAFEMNDCISDPECLALIACLQDCTPGDMACSQACAAAHPAGLPEAQAVRMCRNTFCDGSCP